MLKTINSLSNLLISANVTEKDEIIDRDVSDKRIEFLAKCQKYPKFIKGQKFEINFLSLNNSNLFFEKNVFYKNNFWRLLQ